MSDGEVPRLFITYAHDSEAHKERVRRFAAFLHEKIGLDVHLDQWYDNKRQDWSSWAIEHLAAADFVVVIASPEYKRRADGAAPADEGRGSQFEAAMLRNNLTKDLRRATERILPVVLPGQTAEDIPTFLNPYSTTRFHVSTFTREGVAELIAAITGKGRHQPPERGQWLGGTASGTTVPEYVSLANGLPWLASGAGVRSDSALIDGVRYVDSIVLRPSASAIETLGFVEVDLGLTYRRLTAIAGVLDDAEESFQVGHFVVSADGTTLAEYRVALGMPEPVEVDVTGALKLRLEMYRPRVGASPRRDRRPGRLPELAWGNPALFG
ncbi:SEFIR domain-containing protein [Amycolatopsis samaneae]|uniref:SEFIR domain-containing protein n=1 Tax=Amycolatopsis samaneae TaxID=664691 RepID=A0ABW5G8L0_9PSEU